VTPKGNVVEYNEKLEVAIGKLKEKLRQVIQDVFSMVLNLVSETKKKIKGPKHVDEETMGHIKEDFLQMEKSETEIGEELVKVLEINSSVTQLATKARIVILKAEEVINLEREIMTRIDGFQSKEERGKRLEDAKKAEVEARCAEVEARCAEVEAVVAEIEYEAVVNMKKGEKAATGAKTTAEKTQKKAKELRELADKRAIAVKEVEGLEKEELEEWKEMVVAEKRARQAAESRAEEAEKRAVDVEEMVKKMAEAQAMTEETSKRMEKIAVELDGKAKMVEVFALARIT